MTILQRAYIGEERKLWNLDFNSPEVPAQLVRLEIAASKLSRREWWELCERHDPRQPDITKRACRHHPADTKRRNNPRRRMCQELGED